MIAHVVGICYDLRMDKKKLVRSCGIGCVVCLLAPFVLVALLRALLWLASLVGAVQFFSEHPELLPK